MERSQTQPEISVPIFPLEFVFTVAMGFVQFHNCSTFEQYRFNLQSTMAKCRAEQQS